MRVKTIFFICLIGVPTLMLAAEPGLSNAILLAGSSKTIPYEDGGWENVPSAAARISCMRCTHLCCGEERYDFEIEVFETCWEPVYSIEFEGIEGTIIEAAAWPTGWTAGTMPDLLGSSDRLVFETDNNPILAGRRMAGFSLLSVTGHTVFRWYPANEEGLLMGKVTREELSCTTTASESPTWGSVKALYR
jgi:hypothetical protein